MVILNNVNALVEVYKAQNTRNNNPMCDECDKLAEVVAIGINAPIWECSECGKEIVDDQCKG